MNKSRTALSDSQVTPAVPGKEQPVDELTQRNVDVVTALERAAKERRTPGGPYCGINRKVLRQHDIRVGACCLVWRVGS